jgi:peptidoglycan/xylan/chitin deacetylase (PgdA/CDA1 family)
MAKKKVTKKPLKKRVVRRYVHKQKHSSRYPILALIFIFIILLGFIKIYSAANINHPKFSNNFALKPISLKTKTTPTTPPTITPTNTPTPVPLVGYCMHVPILMYHHIQPESNAKQLGQTALTVDSETFDSQMQYLSQNGYTTLFVDELTNALISHQGLPAKSIVITMDDGYEDNYIYALPILKKYGLKANIALATGLMNNSNMLSWDEVKSLTSSGLIYFTNHTWSHYPITKTPQAKIEMEIDVAQKQIKDYTGQQANIFTYPYGQFNNNAIQTLQSKGYVGAFSEIPGQYQCDSFIMTLHRTRVGNGTLSSYGI